MKIVSKSLLDTEEIAKDFIEKISVGYYDTALVVGLYGDLGSGKTTFTQSVARIFNIKEDITSPTFVIEKIYPVKYPSKTDTSKAGFNRVNDIGKDKFKKLIHIDAYRLDSAKELSALDWERTLADSKNIIFIEWPERVMDVLPQNHAKIFFKFLSENEREIEI
ncbi:MAG: tRNA (adenosine(37)-N6)-threonylcarbamoyltransferase complex ATPase subunit type 1 TsaE [Nanoarchaeota archaeon]